MTLQELRTVRDTSLFPPSVGEFVDALLTYLHEREGGPFPGPEIDQTTGHLVSKARKTPSA